jgi:primosomal protein N'
MALRYLNCLETPLEHAAIISIDSLLALPDFRAGERVFSAILSLRSIASKTFTLQTRRPEDPVIDLACRGDILGFYRHELAVRQALLYPPFAALIKLTIAGREDVVRGEMFSIEKFLSEYKPIIYPAFTEVVRGKFIMNALLKLPASLASPGEPASTQGGPAAKWPDEALIAKLRSLPPHVDVEIDPESVL